MNGSNFPNLIFAAEDTDTPERSHFQIPATNRQQVNPVRNKGGISLSRSFDISQPSLYKSDSIPAPNFHALILRALGTRDPMEEKLGNRGKQGEAWSAMWYSQYWQYWRQHCGNIGRRKCLLAMRINVNVSS